MEWEEIDQLKVLADEGREEVVRSDIEYTVKRALDGSYPSDLGVG